MQALTPELQQAVEQAGDQPVEMTDPRSNTAYVLIKAEIFSRMKKAIEDEPEKLAWASLARKTRSEWAKENPY